MTTKIEWADESWNPVTGCSPVSEGCRNCYAKRMATRLRGRAGYPQDEPFRVTLHPERLDQPLRWRKPRRIFVCSMGDLFHEDVDPLFRRAVIFRSVTAAESGHQVLLLTKRPQLMEAYFDAWPACMHCNLWLGVSIEDQATADERIPWLLRTPAAHRFVSYEPALGPVTIFDRGCPHPIQTPIGERLGPGVIDLIIAGGETGLGARPAHPDWFRSVRDQCVAARVPFFFKSRGEWAEEMLSDEHARIVTRSDSLHRRWAFNDSLTMVRVGRKRAGRLLDGREWNGEEEQDA